MDKCFMNRYRIFPKTTIDREVKRHKTLENDCYKNPGLDSKNKVKW